VDNDYGLGTTDYVRAFQELYGLGTDGVWGASSAGKMKEVLGC
jgi:peptidoglycan hydrolase-like protein with peptidoglycan-binding domain